ncbi:uncharacterized protein A1O5_08764 [Cladophialophora psammophila CBS 110553]|uniref:F-box domain-containing protein n=1 Tax=Cladophialophora psammophila CBS 110553 TaxID=1182543 RepID=W9XCI2_9EURO|nr:uncharacterized protein A1O5_08764 [Cladophialophora psammophila CBS 110553]EXJ68149.1 hypothetical protein A1O5_08764 [Cladophialophora psammophila CBS 110553]
MSDRSLASRAHSAATLGSIPSEVLQQIFYFSTSPSFFQLIQVNRKFFSLASQSREVILHHLRHVPGIKLGLEDHSISTSDLFLIFRQRAASHLYGVNFTADCRSWGLSHRSVGSIDSRASCLGVESEWGNNVCLVLKNSLRIRLNWHNDLPGESIESPYADGRAKIVQVVQKSHYITVLYAWSPPEEDPANDTSHPEPTMVRASVKEVLEDSKGRHLFPRYGWPSSSKQNSQSKASSSLPRIRYHILHYDMFRSDRPIFFPIPTHKSIHNNLLVPVHLAVHNRLQCAILWDLPDAMTPTMDTTVCLYTTDHLPRYEQGEYSVWVLYPFDRPTPIYRSGSGDRFDLARENSNDDIDGTGTTYTVTCVREKFNRSGYDVGQDLRLLNFPLRPRSVAFFKDGRRLSLYAPGSTVPFTTLLANETIRNRAFSPMLSPVGYPSHGDSLHMRRMEDLRRRIRRTNHTSIYGNHFTLGLPFFNTHETVARPDNPELDITLPEVECLTHMLCVGTAKIPTLRIHTAGGVVTETGPQVLTIVQIRKRVLYDLCPHIRQRDDLPTLPRPPREHRRRRHLNIHLHPNAEAMPDVIIAPEVGDDDDDIGNNIDNESEPDVDMLSDTDVDDTDAEALEGTDLRVVARLWGWAPHCSTLTGQDTISISSRGERIAVAQWDRVLVYALNPGELCDEAWDEGNESDDAISEGDSSSESGSDSENEDDGGGSVMSGVEDVVNGAENQDPGNGNGNDNPNDGAQHPLAPSDHSPAISNPGTVPSPVEPPKPAESVASSTSTSLSGLFCFYPHVKDSFLGGGVVELRPIVLKMDGGAVVRKMSWALGRPVRVDEDRTNDTGEMYHRGEETKGVAAEKGGTVKEKEKEEDAGALASNNTARLTPLREDTEGGRNDNTRASADVRRSNPPDQPQASELLQSQDQSSPKSDLQTETLSKNTYIKVQEEGSGFLPSEIPPSPFSDARLTGQIKHIAHPPDHHSSPSKVFLGPPPELRPPSPADVDLIKGKEAESMEASAGEVRKRSQDMTTDHEQAGPSAAELSESVASESTPPYKRKREPRKRVAENELIVLTDRGLQIWDLSVWGKGRRLRCELPGDDILL